MRKVKGESRTFIMVIFSILILGIVIAMAYYVGWPLIKYGSISLCWGKFTSQIGELKAGTIYMGEHKEVDVDFGTCALSVFFVNKDALQEIEDIAKDVEDQMKAESGREIDLVNTLTGECEKDKEAFIITCPWFGEAPEAGGVMTWVMAGAAIGYWAGGKIPLLSKVKVKGMPVLNTLAAALGIYKATELRKKVNDLLKHIEEWGKKPSCFSLNKPFSIDFKPIPFEVEDGEWKQPEGSYCITLYKGRERYYVDYFEGKCKDNTENINKRIEEFREEDKE